MTSPEHKCACGTALADGGPVGLYCPNHDCRIEADTLAKAFKAIRKRDALSAALAVPEVRALVEAAKEARNCGFLPKDEAAALRAALRAVEGRG